MPTFRASASFSEAVTGPGSVNFAVQPPRGIVQGLDLALRC